MSVQLEAVIGVVAETSARVRTLVEVGRVDAAEQVCLTLMYVLDALLASETDSPPAWVRTVRLLANDQQRLALDALDFTSLDQARTRMAALLDVPDIAALGSLGDLHHAIGAAIAVGAPRYNRGDIRGCCTIYFATMYTLVAAPVFRGISGYARALGPLRAALEMTPPPLPLDAAGIDEYAWTLRHAFDAALAING
jgi:hypothetical protein